MGFVDRPVMRPVMRSVLRVGAMVTVLILAICTEACVVFFGRILDNFSNNGLFIFLLSSLRLCSPMLRRRRGFDCPRLCLIFLALVGVDCFWIMSVEARIVKQGYGTYSQTPCTSH